MENKTQYITVDTEKEYSLKELVSILREICKSQNFRLNCLKMTAWGIGDVDINNI